MPDEKEKQPKTQEPIEPKKAQKPAVPEKPKEEAPKPKMPEEKKEDAPKPAKSEIPEEKKEDAPKPAEPEMPEKQEEPKKKKEQPHKAKKPEAEEYDIKVENAVGKAIEIWLTALLSPVTRLAQKEAEYYVKAGRAIRDRIPSPADAIKDRFHRKKQTPPQKPELGFRETAPGKFKFDENAGIKEFENFCGVVKTNQAKAGGDLQINLKNCKMSGRQRTQLISTAQNDGIKVVDGKKVVYDPKETSTESFEQEKRDIPTFE